MKLNECFNLQNSLCSEKRGVLDDGCGLFLQGRQIGGSLFGEGDLNFFLKITDKLHKIMWERSLPTLSDTFPAIRSIRESRLPCTTLFVDLIIWKFNFL